MSGFIATTVGAPGRVAALPAWQSAMPSQASASGAGQLTWTSADLCGRKFTVAGITAPTPVLPLFGTTCGTVSRATVDAAALRRAADIDSTHDARTSDNDEYRLRGRTRWRPV